VILPGARGPGDPGYTPLIDGTPPAGLPNEMAAVSNNFMTFLAALSNANVNDPDCNPSVPITCTFVRAAFAIAGAQRPDVTAGGNGTFGRRDFLWHAGAELAIHYQKRNILGFSTDFAEDRFKTNWSMELAWSSGEELGNAKRARGYSTNDTLGLGISVDRPTFINFLNSGRTFFFNTQFFARYVFDYVGNDSMGDGPYSFLSTFTVATGYAQDRLLPALTAVYDFGTNSGGLIGQVSYRMSEVMTASFGFANFWGRPELARQSVRSPLPGNSGPDYRARTAYGGLSPISERDELFFSIRYTF
jgi:hypothetical protein